MADKKISIPINMRPRSTPNAEINAQTREKTVREMLGEPEPFVKEVTPRGYSHGGAVKKYGSPKISAPCKDSKTIKCS